MRILIGSDISIASHKAIQKGSDMTISWGFGTVFGHANTQGGLRALVGKSSREAFGIVLEKQENNESSTNIFQHN
jgi:hypothetical protein